MARLRDFPIVVRKMGPVAFVKKVWFEINDDNLYTWAASLAYSWLFAIFPFFVFLLTIIPLLRHEWKQEAVRRIDAAVETLPLETQHVLHDYLDPRLKQLLYQPPPRIKGILSLGLIITIWAASGGLHTSMAAMNKCYDVEKVRPYYIARPMAIGLTVVVATLVLAVIVLLPIGTLVTEWLTSGAERAWTLVQPGSGVATTVPAAARVIFHPVWLVLWQILRYSVGISLMFSIVAIIYHFGPRIKQKRRVLTPGSVFTVAMWILLGMGFRIYIDKYGKYGQTYGTVGGVAILLLLFYLDALMLLIGAEINAEVDFAMKNVASGPAEDSIAPPRSN